MQIVLNTPIAPDGQPLHPARTPGMTERLLEFQAPDPDPVDPLTRRERDALALVADGKTDWEVSVILGISEATARFHIDNGRKKLGAVNRAQAVARMANRRLI